MKEKPKIAFFGTPQLAVTILDELKVSGIEPDLIVTAPDKPAGRKLQLTPPPVKIWAEKHSIPTLQPEKMGADFVQQMQHQDWGTPWNDLPLTVDEVHALEWFGAVLGLDA